MGEDVTNRIHKVGSPSSKQSTLTKLIADTTHRILPEIFSLLATIPSVVTNAWYRQEQIAMDPTKLGKVYLKLEKS
jgi:hypothetical protein